MDAELMYHFYADDGRILTPPTELKPLQKDAFPAFTKLLGHIRFFYMADEIWDGKSSLVFLGCDLCLGSKKSDEKNFLARENFGYMNWLCYHNCVPGVDVDRWDGVFNCPGCAETRKTTELSGPMQFGDYRRGSDCIGDSLLQC